MSIRGEKSMGAGSLSASLIRPFQSFVKKEASGSILLLAAAVLAFTWANSPYASTYHRFWEAGWSFSAGGYEIGRSLRDWINEGLMAVFFFTVGLEIKRELLVGELASAKKALLPAVAALGGMIFPALFYVIFNLDMPSVSGWGIPMATDIAFALGALYVLGRRVPLGLRVFLSALAIVDDLGAVLVIALFYTKGIAASFLAAGFGIFVLLVLANYLGVRSSHVYAALGILLWFAFLGSGLHATVAGVIVAFCIPARGGYDTDNFVREVKSYISELECLPGSCGFSIMENEKHQAAVQSIELACHHVETPLQRFENGLHGWVAFLIVPLFALANAGLTVGQIDIRTALLSPVTLGIVSGLAIGKPLGIVLFSVLLVKTGMASLPAGVRWSQIGGVGLLGGIGFTMSLFIADLSFAAPPALDYAKVGVFLSSVLSAAAGLVFLFLVSVRRRTS